MVETHRETPMNDTLLFLCLAILFLSPGFFVRRHMTETPPGMRREVVAIRIGAILIAMALMSGRERWWTLALLYPDTSELPLVDKVEWNTVASGFEIVDVPIVFRGEQVDYYTWPE
jgi:hypothetical protein